MSKTPAVLAAELRKEASDKLTDILSNIHRQITPNFDPRMSLLPERIERIVECLVSAAMLEVTDVFRQGLKERPESTTAVSCGGSCDCHKS